MRQGQTIPGHVLENVLITMFVIVEYEIEVVTMTCCRAKYGRKFQEI